MNISIDTTGMFPVARLSGDFGLDDGDQLLEQLQPLVAEAGSRLAIVLEDVTFINSSGLDALIALGTRARLSQGRLVLVAPSKFVRGVLEVTQLDGWFEIRDDLEAAGQELA